MNTGIPSDSGLATYHCFTSQQLPEVSKGPHGDQAHRWWRWNNLRGWCYQWWPAERRRTSPSTHTWPRRWCSDQKTSPQTARRLKVARISSSKLPKTWPWPYYQGTSSEMTTPRPPLLVRRSLLRVRSTKQHLDFLRNLSKNQHASKDPQKCPELLCWQRH